MSMRWKVFGIPLEVVNRDGGSSGEPFAAIQLQSGTIVLTKQEVFYEGDEAQSSAHERNQQLERERG